ncbi:hypothetical protein B4U80_00267 [Leptotrombidium deliense]|uniref:C-type lectin domain-containing protein n=1 Tax=Leptotrombidium deliense TaxID=299467 RepID=A0A443RY31_9ACAR|nr:hypothetical protein B4U80_00267 [Leptotrombidium deliense]
MKQYCESIGGSLVTIQSEDENYWFRSSFLAYSTFIGLKRESNGWQWIDGKPFSYSNWAPGQPDNEGGNEKCVEFWNGGTSYGLWNDLPCDFSRYTVCKMINCDAFVEKEKEKQRLPIKAYIDSNLAAAKTSILSQFISVMENRITERADRDFERINSTIFTLFKKYHEETSKSIK